MNNHTCIQLGGVYSGGDCYKKVPAEAPFVSNETCLQECLSSKGPECVAYHSRLPATHCCHTLHQTNTPVRVRGSSLLQYKH